MFAILSIPRDQSQLDGRSREALQGRHSCAYGACRMQQSYCRCANDGEDAETSTGFYYCCYEHSSRKHELLLLTPHRCRNTSSSPSRSITAFVSILAAAARVAWTQVVAGPRSCGVDAILLCEQGRRPSPASPVPAVLMPGSERAWQTQRRRQKAHCRRDNKCRKDGQEEP